jgi:hypothetical protein
VREGTLESLLSTEAVVRVRVPRPRADAAIETLIPIGPAAAMDGPEETAAEVWLRVQATPDRAADVNRALATAGIYASALESGSDLENLFLELTGGEAQPGSEGTFQGIVTPRGSGGSGGR